MPQNAALEEGVELVLDEPRQLQALTPETATSTHYFFQEAHRADQGDESTRQVIFESLATAFEEDRRMIQAQARTIALDPTAPMLALGMDVAIVRFRRLIEERRAAEARDPVARS